MEEIEVPTESVQEELNHEAVEHKDKWTTLVALASAILAALAAVTALMSGHHSNEAMIEQLKASDQWSFFQAKGIKAAVINSKASIFEALGKKLGAEESEKIERYKKEQAEIEEHAKELEHSAQHHLARHLILARGVTLFQVAIAVAAISALTRRRRYFTVSLAFGACGLVFLIQELFFS